MNDSSLDITGAESLVQRFVDQELSGEERVRLLVRLGRDQALRDRVLELERLTLDVSRLPRPVVPDNFVARVLERTDPGPSAWRRVTEALWAPRALQWNLAGAMAVAGMVLLAAGVLSRRPVAEQTDLPAPTAATTAAPAGEQVLVRLVVLQPDANSVEVAGDFNGWDPRRTPLEQMTTGAWTVTIPLDPGRYEYMFVVNGEQWVADPFAVEQTDDGFGSRNAVLDVRPPAEASL